jgi:exopolysaccharide biosynthesis protein
MVIHKEKDSEEAFIVNPMRKKIFRIVITTVLISLVWTSIISADSNVYEKINRENIAKGVTHENILRFNENGWLKAHVLFVDLDDGDVKLELLKSSKGLTIKETLSSLVNNTENVVGAVNGDFFYLTTPDSPMGLMVKDGQMISSPVIEQNFAALYIDEGNNAYADYLKYNIQVITDKGKIIPIAAINKYTHEYQSIMLIDGNWGEYSPGFSEKYYDMVEVMVVEDIVVEVRRNQPSVLIPDNGYILLASQGQASVLYDNLQVGDKVTQHFNAGPSLENIQFAIGGGTLLVKGGQVVSFTQNVSGNHPRTAAGITRDRKQLILVTVDGRHKSFPGVDGRGLANLMIELGSYEAIILDGGGSTTMLKRDLGTFDVKVANNPSEGTQRRIINGIGIVSKAPKESLEGIKAEVEETRGFIGIGKEINVKAYDRNFNPLPVNYSQVNFTVKAGEGSFSGNRFIPGKSGKTIVEASYMGVSAQITLNIFNKLERLKILPETISLNTGQSIKLQVLGLDSQGYSVPLQPKDIQWKDADNLGTFKDYSYTAGNLSGATILTASYGNISASVNAAIGQMTVSMGSLGKYQPAFLGYPVEVTGYVVEENDGKDGGRALRLEYDFTNTDAVRAAYIDFKNGNIMFAKKPVKLGMWVYAYENSTQWIRGRIKDGSGQNHTIDFKKGIDWIGWNYVETEIPENLSSPIQLDRIYVVETDPLQKGRGKLLFDELQVLSSVALPDTEEAINNFAADSLNTPYSNKGTQFFVYSGIQFNNGATLLDTMVSGKIIDLINMQYDVSIFTGNVDPKMMGKVNKPYITALPGYSVQEHGENVIIHLDNRSKGLRQTDFKQWPWLKNILNDTTKKNVFVVLPQPVWGNKGFSDELEADLFIETLSNAAAKGKKVFVLYGGETMQGDLIDGVRFISTGNYSNNTAKNPKNAFRYIEFNITGESVTYQIKTLFGE